MTLNRFLPAKINLSMPEFSSTADSTKLPYCYGRLLSDHIGDERQSESAQSRNRNMGMALGMSGQVDAARKLFMDAVKKYSQLSIEYYNLACADAEQATPQSSHHLQKAFDRKANVISGERLPDPAKDVSILKLKGDKPFWTFVETLLCSQVAGCPISILRCGHRPKDDRT